MCCSKACTVWRVLHLSTPDNISNQNQWLHLYTVSSCGLHWAKTEPPPTLPVWCVCFSIEMRQKILRSELKLCALHFRRTTYCGLQVVHSACIWKRHRSTLPVSQKGWEEENYLSNLPYTIHLPPAKRLIYHKLAIHVFAGFSRNIWHRYYLWSDKFPSFHPSPSLLLQLGSPPVFPRIRWFLLQQAVAPFPLLVPGLDGMVTVAYVCLLGSQRCKWRYRR